MRGEQARIRGYQPGDLGMITWLHASFYHEHWGHDSSFECEVAAGLAEFIGRMDPERDGLWIAEAKGRFAGSVAIDGKQKPARLRWFIVHPEAQGLGLGRELLRQSVDFCRQAGHGQVLLWTFKGLTAARKLYDELGFVETEQKTEDCWGREGVIHQRLDLEL